MEPSASPTFTRRSALKTVGAFALLSTAGVSTTAAKPERKGNNFGNGNGVGAFLNEPALYKPSPVWSDGVVDMTGQDTVEVVTGAMTNVELPGLPFPSLPVAFAPVAVEVSPGTEVVWTWQAYPEGFPLIPHNVVSLKEDENGPLFANPEDVIYQPGLTYSVTFDEPGNYLYYCTPHGAPFEVENFEGKMVYNEFGMRGAVIVTDE